MSDTKLLTAREAKQKLAELIDKRPSLDMYQRMIAKNLKSFKSLNDRMVYLFNLMDNNGQRMQNASEDLQELITKATYPD